MPQITIQIYLIFTLFLIVCGVFGVIVQKSLFGMILSSNMIFLGAALNFSIFDKFVFLSSGEGSVFTFVTIILGLSSIIVTTAFILVFYRDYKSLDSDLLNNAE